MAYCSYHEVHAEAVKNADKTFLLHCITKFKLNIPMQNCPVLTVQFRECHISIPEESGVRRFVLIPDRGYCDDGEFYATPKVISVEASCIVRVSFNTFT